ncbi:NAD(P)-dependent oxidoreductase [Acuticoccus sp. I52.16.1]|uniref:NAD-dependent epimerase/dehydratase family protein n=1 Tax=Acuticoccus sp. I52.16.1 TaxID=2928472 RepID=UPI001FD3F207|nr:NAD(P)-dependent oxidoreductase [Acuticoccus sp. I52.16.1]UOM36148.1 NAD(P)-dependent oxidoreductase [Acuticoccus sp. I52.16.1]
MTILVTGAGGFVGLNVVERLLTDGHTVVALGNRPLPSIARDHFSVLPGQLHPVTADVRDAAALRAAIADFGVTRIFHGAAITLGPAGTIAPPTDVIDINVVSMAVLLELAREFGIARFVYPSSTAVYAGYAFAAALVTEDMAPTPNALYGYTKLACERLALEAAARHGLSIALGRITAAFGPWEHDTGVRETLSPPYQLARKAVASEPVVIADRGWRDWTSSRDVARVFALLLTTDTLAHDTYNISLGETWSPARLAEALSMRLPVDWSIGPPNISYNDDLSRRRSALSNARLARDFGYRFMTPDEAAGDYAAWVADFGATGFAALENPRREAAPAGAQVAQ